MLSAWSGLAGASVPIFENRTPIGFAPADSSSKADFVVGEEVHLRVDLNQAVTNAYPLFGHFHSLEKSDQVGTVATDGMQVDIAIVDVVPFGTNSDQPAPGDTTAAVNPAIHMAWIEEIGTTANSGTIYNGGLTPVYEVKYARSFDGGATFSTPVNVANDISYHILTTGDNSSFSTLDLEVDSAGNPRLVFAFISTADRARNENVYFSYSQNGGGTWLPSSGPLVVNDSGTVGNSEGKSCAFPRMAIDDRDDIYISYVRGLSSITATSDVMLAKVNRIPATFAMHAVGESGTAGTGGVRLSIDGERHMGPDLAIGDGNALHALYFNDTDNRIEHKRVNTDTTWADVSTSSWSSGADGASVAAFDNAPATNEALEKGAVYYFPTIAVDRKRLPDKVYSVFKLGVDNSPSTSDEGIFFNQYDDDGSVGAGANWGTATSVWSSAPSPLFVDGNQVYNIELDWELTERVAALVDDRLDDRGDLHIAFSAGYSSGGEHDIYYARYNGSDWSLPEKVADDDSDGTGTEDGIDNADVFLLSPALAGHPDKENIYLAFAGGSGEGFGIDNLTDVNHRAYFKVLGRDITSEDQSVPVGAYEYTLSYTPVNPQGATAEIENNPVYVLLADPATGRGLGAAGKRTDGFLIGDWEAVATSLLTDNDKFFEGRVDEDSDSTNEWGDDDDKNGLLVKLNVLGSDSSTNVQIVNNSTASDAGTGKGSRSVRVTASPTFSSFVSAGSFFALGADIDIVVSNSAPTVSISNPDGNDDEANTSYTISYDLQDGDDALSGSLKAALYFFPSAGLKTVQDIRIFATLIADENDVSSNNAAGTDDLAEGTGQDYTWDDPPDALKTSALFASIYKAQSDDYYIYLVADDQKNPPVFAVSPGPLTIKHSPIIQQIDPIAADIVDSGVRTGLQASPYDLDFTVVDYDGEAQVQLFYASVSGITTVSATGVYPNQQYVLGKSLSGTRGTAITESTSLTSRDTEYSWDITSPVVVEGGYYLYAVATDSVNVSVGNSTMTLSVQHSPSFEFYEPPRDTQRDIDTGSQPVYTIQWQKGPGDQDLDDNATIDLYFTTDDPAVSDHATASGAASTSLLSDVDTKLIVSGLSENDDGKDDMYVWNFRDPPNAVPIDGERVWLYARITDGSNTSVVRGGALLVRHNPYIILETRMPKINQGDIVRLEWDDYMVDDASVTDDAYIRLYASTAANHTTLQSLEENVVGAGGRDDTYIVNSSNGMTSGTITSILESSGNAFNWDTRTSSLSFPTGTFSVYAGISADATFSDNATGRVSKASNQVEIGLFSGINSHLSLSPSKVMASVGDTLLFEVLVQSGGLATDAIELELDLGTTLLTILDSGSPFADLGIVFNGGTELTNSSAGRTISYGKQKSGGEILGTSADPVRLVSFQVRVEAGLSGVKNINFNDENTSLSIVGNTNLLNRSSGMSSLGAQLEATARGRIQATVLLEGRASPIGNGDHSTLLDVHLRQPGSTIDITESHFVSSNDDMIATADTVEVQTTSIGGLTLVSVPAGRYVLAVKDTSHLSGRTDTLSIRAGETLTLSSAQGFYASDVRGDASFLLHQAGTELQAGDVTEDNEIDEDDINALDAAWGTDTGKPRFKAADLNNDGRVGVEDLTVTTSNINNSTGFGAPPVFKPAGVPRNVDSGLEILAPDAGEWRRGEEIELIFMARELNDLAGYAFDLKYDPMDMDLVGGTAGMRAADLFRENPQGYFKRLQHRPGLLSVAAARRGKQWSANGAGELLRVRVRLFQDGFPKSLQVQSGKLLNSKYEQNEIRLLSDPRELGLPQDFALGQNYPNPFNPSTTIPFAVPVADDVLGTAVLAPVSVEIFNMLGQQVHTLVQGNLQPGYYSMVWDGRNSAGRAVATGIYFYKLQVGGKVQVRRMTLVK